MTSPFDFHTSSLADFLPPASERPLEALLFCALDQHFESSDEASGQSGKAEPNAGDFSTDFERRVAAIRDEVTAAARQHFTNELSARLAEEHRRMDRARLEFARDRQRFFTAAESQVVRLALAIASDVLAREIDATTLHLADAVKLALSRVQSSSETTLRVPVHDVVPWTAMFERSSVGKVAVIADVTLKGGDCVLETTVGRVEFGVGLQLAEVERRFARLLQEDALSVASDG